MNSWRHRFTRFSRGIAQALLVSSLGFTAMAVQAEDDPPGRVGRLAEMKGQVWLLEAGQGEWQTAERNRPVTTSDRLATDADSRAELQIGSTTIRLDQGSDLEVTRLDDERIELTLHGGAAALRVREAEVAREVLILTPEGRFQPRSPGLFRIDRGDRGSLASSTRGELDFESSDSQLALRAGQRAELWLDQGDRRTHYNWVGMPNDEFETWVRADDSRDERYATRRPISPEMTGADDLDGNGEWGTHPEYGSMWTPTTVAVGWAPYRYGRWAWVRPWGWTWVDDAPWGFAPFHYGRWVHWHGRWRWAPGTYVRRPVYAPAMVGWVGGAHLSVGISIGRPVGWVPLAPREVYYPQYRVSPVYIKQVNVTHIRVQDNHRPAPNRPIMYANGKVAGGVTVVSSDVLTRRQAIGNAQRPSDTSVMAAMRSPRAAVAVEPPKPDNASFAPRAVRQQGSPVVPPPRSVARADRGDRGDDRGGPRAGTDRSAQVQGGQPGRPGEPAVARPGANPRDARADQGRDQTAGDQVRDRREPARDGAAAERPNVQRPPITPRDGQREQRNNQREAVPGFQQRERDNVPGFSQPRREQPAPQQQQPQQQQQQQPQSEPRERREGRDQQPQGQQAAPREDRQQQHQQRQAERQERQQERQEKQDRQREPNNNKRERESRSAVN